MNRLTMPLLRLLLLAVLAPMLTGCLHQNFYIDPKPTRMRFDDLPIHAARKPVQLIFDVKNENGAFPEATGKLAPKVLEVVTFSGLFSSVVKVGSDNLPRLQLVLTVTPLPGRDELPSKSVPSAVSVHLPGTEGGFAYTLTSTFQPAGQPAEQKIYHHAVHVAGGGPRPAGVRQLRAISAVEEIVEQMLLTCLRDLHQAGKL